MAYDGEVRWLIGKRNGGSPKLPSVARCILAIAAIKILLGVAGSGATIRWIKQRTANCATHPTTPEDVVALEYAVAMAAALYPGRAACLERSLVLFYLARRAGIPVTYHHGVQPLPLKAHAWVEYEGHVINDVVEFVNTFLPFPRIMP
jgi:transglutaminase superfamily protein